MILRTSFKPEEHSKVVEELETLEVPFSVRRKSNTDEVEIRFDEDVEEAAAYALVASGKKKHRLRNKASYDDLNIEDYTPAQINNYIDNQVSNLADVKRVLKIFARIILYLVKHLNDDV